MRIAWTVLAAIQMAGCSSWGLQPDVPAVRTSPTPASTAELEQIVATATNSSQVTISQDALVGSSELIIERQPNRTLQSPPASGRDYGRPHRFTLVIDGPQCFLVHAETGLHWMLRETTCRAE